ncbi:hypothetical protein [Acinetobacter sp. AG3]|uniref:hypothetical protein n=1 Tax=unclassified Acinetobacter TaxID=196816 RepID=UPI001EF130ED|nr:hypothetical protein [Acinetobacter sp. AG3]MCG7219499.1 hypothetical protein [Acinetobacter sp. AG3]
MHRLKNMALYINDQYIGTPISVDISIDLASEPDYSVKTLVHKQGATLSFIPLSKTLSTLDQLKQHFVQKNQKQNRLLLPGTYISTLSP